MQILKCKDTKLVSYRAGLCGGSPSTWYCELCTTSQRPRVGQSMESGLCSNGPYRGLKESGIEHENLFWGGGGLFCLRKGKSTGKKPSLPYLCMNSLIPLLVTLEIDANNTWLYFPVFSFSSVSRRMPLLLQFFTLENICGYFFFPILDINSLKMAMTYITMYLVVSTP